MTFLGFWNLEFFTSVSLFAVGYCCFRVENTLYDWTAASGKCDLAGSEESLREECSDDVPSDGRAYWVGAIQENTGLFRIGGCNAYNDPRTLVFRQSIINSTRPVLDCYRACVKYHTFALSSDTCFCKNQTHTGPLYSCTPVQFRPGSADFHGGSNGVVEYDKLNNLNETMQDIKQDDVGDCVSCQQFTETCVNYSMTPCTTELVYKCGTKFYTTGGPWWDSIRSCNGFRAVVPNRTAVWTRISRRSTLVWTKSRCPAVDELRVRCLSVTKINNTIYLNPRDCLTKLPSLCQRQPSNQDTSTRVAAKLTNTCIYDGLPSTSTTDGLPSTSTTGGLPSTSTTDGLPSTSTTGSLPSTSTTDGLPSTSTTDGLPSTSTTDGLPSTSTTDGLPSTSTTDGLPSTSTTDGLPSTSTTDGLPSTSTTGGLPSTTGGLPSTSTTDGLPSTSTTGGLPSTSTTGGLPSTSTTGGLPSTSTTGGLPSTSTTDGLPSTSTTEGLPSTSTAEKLPAPGKYKPPQDAHDNSTVPLAVVFALACLAAFVFLGTTIYFRRQRNEERLHRLREENYVSSNFVETEQEPHQYTSLQDITGPHRSLSSEGEGKGIHQS